MTAIDDITTLPFYRVNIPYYPFDKLRFCIGASAAIIASALGVGNLSTWASRFNILTNCGPFATIRECQRRIALSEMRILVVIVDNRMQGRAPCKYIGYTHIYI